LQVQVFLSQLIMISRTAALFYLGLLTFSEAGHYNHCAEKH
jgi:hypothetical protein